MEGGFNMEGNEIANLLGGIGSSHCAGNMLNAILDPILIFGFGFGIGGAAIATVISEYLIAFILLWELTLISPNIDGRRVFCYVISGAQYKWQWKNCFIRMALI